MADVKGDLAGVSLPGKSHRKLEQCASEVGFTPCWWAFPTTLWDLFGKKAYSIRTTVPAMGPLLLARLLQLIETQAGVPGLA